MKRIRMLFLLLTALLLLNIPVFAIPGGMLSPGLQILSNEFIMIKSGLISGVIRFDESDFKRTLGSDFDSIVITSVPLQSDGVLMLGDAPVCVNQTISANSLSSLRYVQNGSSPTGSFKFKSGGGYSIRCDLKYMDSVNYAPTVTSDKNTLPVWTQCNITTYGTLYGADPEGDSITFEIVKYPERGILQLVSASTGDYRYTPCDGIVGEDSFVYAVRDEWGNYSDEISVVVDVDKAATDLVFSDMNGHWAHNAALVMAAEQAMDIEYSDGQLYFNPDEKISREEFIVTVMKALGSKNMGPEKTVFYDNSEISSDASGYIACAYKLGIIKGSYENNRLVFKPKDVITRAEAAVILNTIVGAEDPDTVQTFADSSSIPAWAKSSLYALLNEGIYKGTGFGNISPNEKLNRAQTAQILLNIKKLYSWQIE